MIYPEIKNNELIINGTVKDDENYHGFCCAGHAWRVALIFPDDDPVMVSVWGRCDNQECTEGVVGEDDVYQGVKSVLVEDLALWLLDETAVNEVTA